MKSPRTIILTFSGTDRKQGTLEQDQKWTDVRRQGERAKDEPEESRRQTSRAGVSERLGSGGGGGIAQVEGWEGQGQTGGSGDDTVTLRDGYWGDLEEERFEECL